MHKTYSILRTHLTTPCQFVHNSRLRNAENSLRQFSDKKEDPSKQHKKSVGKFQEGCQLCDNIFKPCDRCPEALSRPECEENVPGCMPFTEDVPMPQPQPQFTEECLSPECATDCRHSSRKGPPRCPRPQRDTSSSENEESKTAELCQDKKDVPKKKPKGCK